MDRELLKGSTPLLLLSLLEDGPMPLPLLRRKMTAWIARQAGGNAAVTPES